MNENEILALLADLPSLSNDFLENLQNALNDNFFSHYDQAVSIALLEVE